MAEARPFALLRWASTRPSSLCSSRQCTRTATCQPLRVPGRIIMIWSMRRFRRKSGEDVGRTIEHMRQFVSEHGAGAVLASAGHVIPGRLRLSAFALTADLLLADGTIEPAERRFLNRLAADLRLDMDAARSLVDAMLVKNRA